MRKAVLISFSIQTKKFRSRYEASKFFRELYGWKQVVCTQSSRYEYERPGILAEVPHVKIDQSSFLVPEEAAERLLDFFEEWRNKVIFKALKILVEEDLEW